jgi:uncharacterized protein YcgI (DUF1989 family)
MALSTRTGPCAVRNSIAFGTAFRTLGTAATTSRMALDEWKVDRQRIPNAFVPFMNVGVNDAGMLEIREPTSEPGDYYDLRAEMELVVAISNCPQERNPCNAFNPTSMGLVIYRSAL